MDLGYYSFKVNNFPSKGILYYLCTTIKRNKMKNSEPKSGWNSGKWNFGDYTRQLSVVVLGIVITFLGTAAINTLRERKEVRNTLKLVCNELLDNKNTMIEIRSRIELEVDAARFLLAHKDDIKSADADSLDLYCNIPFEILFSSTSADALELMKTSGIFSKLSNETLGLEIIKTYNEIRVTAETFQYLTKIKEEGIRSVSQNLDDQFILFAGHPATFIWDTIFAIPQGENMLMNISYIFKSEYFDNVINTIDVTVMEIEEML